MISNSWASSLPGLSRIRFEMPSFPMSCTSAALRIKPSSAAALRHIDRSIEAITAVENFDCLREAGDAAENGNGITLQPARMALPIPMFIEALDGGGGFLWEEQRPRDGRAAVAA